MSFWSVTVSDQANSVLVVRGWKGPVVVVWEKAASAVVPLVALTAWV